MDHINMPVRLQVLLSESEMDEIRLLARRKGFSVGKWVRNTLREACAGQPVHEPQSKLQAVRRAAEYFFPTAEISPMLDEIERGYDD
jgi:hypothetical protein